MKFCLHCQRRFLIEEAHSEGRVCDDCLRPEDLPGPGDHRITAAMAQAAYQCAVAENLQVAGRTLRHQAQALRRESQLLREPAGRGAARFNRELPVQGEAGNRWDGSGDVGALVIGDRIPDAALLLTPTDYPLPPLEHPLLLLSPDEADPTDQATTPLIPELPDLRSASSTTLYAWGYAAPQSPLCRDQCEATEAAAQVALGAGWKSGRPGAWAGEVCLGLSLSEMLRWVVPILRNDPGVVGWGLRMRRRP